MGAHAGGFEAGFAAEMWKQVGYASLAEFEDAFKAFLQGL
jgi:hypothetical protein